MHVWGLVDYESRFIIDQYLELVSIHLNLTAIHGALLSISEQ